MDNLRSEALESRFFKKLVRIEAENISDREREADLATKALTDFVNELGHPEVAQAYNDFLGR